MIKKMFRKILSPIVDVFGAIVVLFALLMMTVFGSGPEDYVKGQNFIFWVVVVAILSLLGWGISALF
jgi:hypothetical protein